MSCSPGFPWSFRALSWQIPPEPHSRTSKCLWVWAQMFTFEQDAPSASAGLALGASSCLSSAPRSSCTSPRTSSRRHSRAEHWRQLGWTSWWPSHPWRNSWNKWWVCPCHTGCRTKQLPGCLYLRRDNLCWYILLLWLHLLISSEFRSSYFLRIIIIIILFICSCSIQLFQYLIYHSESKWKGTLTIMWKLFLFLLSVW